MAKKINKDAALSTSTEKPEILLEETAPKEETVADIEKKEPAKNAKKRTPRKKAVEELAEESLKEEPKNADTPKKKKASSDSEEKAAASHRPLSTRKSLGIKAAPRIPQFRSGGAIVSNAEKKEYRNALYQERKAVQDEFQASLDINSRVKLKGTLVGTSFLNVKQGEPPLVLALVSYKGTIVKIPAHDFLLPYKDKETGEWIPYTRQNFSVETIKKTLKRRLDSEVDFRITKILSDGTAIGSRVLAMEELKDYWWIKSVAKTKSSEGNPVPYIRAGITAKPRIVTVVNSGIYIELLGVESFIPTQELGHIYIDSAKDLYRTGQTIDVVITKVVREDNNIMFWASNRLASLNIFREDFEHVNRGDTYRGEVIFALFDKVKNESAFMVKISDNLQVRCTMGTNITRIPKKGSLVEICITGKYKDTLMLSGLVTHTIKL